MEDIKKKIISVVNEYKNVYKEEYDLFCTQIKLVQKSQTNEFSEIQNSDMVERKIAEYPETLLGVIKARLSHDEFKYFETKEGTRWFVKQFKEFSVSQKI